MPSQVESITAYLEVMDDLSRSSLPIDDDTELTEANTRPIYEAMLKLHNLGFDLSDTCRILSRAVGDVRRNRVEQGIITEEQYYGQAGE